MPISIEQRPTSRAPGSRSRRSPRRSPGCSSSRSPAGPAHAVVGRVGSRTAGAPAAAARGGVAAAGHRPARLAPVPPPGARDDRHQHRRRPGSMQRTTPEEIVGACSRVFGDDLPPAARELAEGTGRAARHHRGRAPRRPRLPRPPALAADPRAAGDRHRAPGHPARRRRRRPAVRGPAPRPRLVGRAADRPGGPARRHDPPPRVAGWCCCPSRWVPTAWSSSATPLPGRRCATPAGASGASPSRSTGHPSRATPPGSSAGARRACSGRCSRPPRPRTSPASSARRRAPSPSTWPSCGPTDWSSAGVSGRRVVYETTVLGRALLGRRGTSAGSDVAIIEVSCRLKRSDPSLR